MDFCMAEIKSEGVNEVQKGSRLRFLGLDICPLIQICNTLWLTYHQKESMCMYKSS